MSKTFAMLLVNRAVDTHDGPDEQKLSYSREIELRGVSPFDQQPSKSVASVV